MDIVQTYLSVTRGSQRATTITVELAFIGKDLSQTSLELSIAVAKSILRDLFRLQNTQHNPIERGIFNAKESYGESN